MGKRFDVNKMEMGKKKKKKRKECDNRLCLGRCRGRREEEGCEVLESCKRTTQNDCTRVK